MGLLRVLLYFRKFLNENNLKVKFKIFKNLKPTFSMIKKYLSDVYLLRITILRKTKLSMRTWPSRSPTLGLFYFGPSMHGP
jgi:CRISPR/Cas system Type II protein with McrA/HNH and RuvC-like nuclease domain